MPVISNYRRIGIECELRKLCFNRLPASGPRNKTVLAASVAKENVSDDPSREQNKPITVRIGDQLVELKPDADGNYVMPAETSSTQEIESTASSIINQAAEVAEGNQGSDKDPSGGNPTNDDFKDKLKGLPMSELIGAPLFAAADAQQRLAGSAWDFYQKIAFDTDSQTQKPTTKTRTVDFVVNRPVVVDGVTKMMEQKVSAPFIGLVPIPSLLVERVDVDFQMEVTDTNVEKNSSSASAEASVSAKWFGTTVSVSGKVASARETTRTTNQTAKYQVHVTAAQQPPTEGMSKLMDIMASCIEPVPNNSGGGGQ